jgi:hypothetical protein
VARPYPMAKERAMMDYFLIFNAWFSLVVCLVCLYVCLTDTIQTGMYYTVGIGMIAMGSAIVFASWLDGFMSGDTRLIIASQASENLGLAVCVLRFISSPKRHTMSRISGMIDTALHIGEIEPKVSSAHFKQFEKNSRPIVK